MTPPEAVADPEAEPTTPDMPGESEAEQPEPEELFDGSRFEITDNLSGPVDPDRSTITFVGEGEFELRDSEFEGGDVVITIREATVEEGTIVYHRDRKANEIHSATRKHKAFVDRTRQVPPEKWDRIRAILEDED